MTTTFLEALPASRSHKSARNIEWTPCDPDARCACSGTLEIRQSKKPTTYLVTMTPTDWDGVAVRMSKADGSEYYAVFVSHDRKECRCDCPGSSWASKARVDKRHGVSVDRAARQCKHVDAVISLIDNGWIADPNAGPDGNDWAPQATPEELDTMAD